MTTNTNTNPPRSITDLYALHLRNSRRERMFLSSLSFLVTFASTRAITHAIKNGLGPLPPASGEGAHLHHLVWGILLLLLVGYLWLAQVGVGTGESWSWMSAITAILYGAGSALTLDEFALWLSLQDVYWTNQGRESIDAIVIFGSLLLIGSWGGPFWRGVPKMVFRRVRSR